MVAAAVTGAASLADLAVVTKLSVSVGPPIWALLAIIPAAAFPTTVASKYPCFPRKLVVSAQP